MPPGSPTCLNPISDQKLFPHPFSDLASKIHTFYQTRRSQKLCYHYLLSSNCKYLQYLRLERQQKKDPFRIRILLFLSYSFEIETTNTFMPSRIPSKTIPEFRPKWAKSILLSGLHGAKTIPFGVAHTHKANIREYTSQGLEAGKREGKALHWKNKCFASVGNEQVVILYSFRKDKLLYNH